MLMPCSVKSKAGDTRRLSGISGPWSEDLKGAALEAVRQIGDEGSRAEALAAVAPYLPEDLKRAAVGEAFEAVRQIGDEWSRAWALVAVAPQLPKHFAAESLKCLIHDLPRLNRERVLWLLMDVVKSGMLANHGKATESLYRALQRVGRSWP